MSFEKPVRASYGMTSYVKTSNPMPDASFGDPYYNSPSYSLFLQTVDKLADQNGVTLYQTQRAVGLYEGSQEPSVAVEATGFREDIETVAQHMCEEFDQQAVHVIFQPGHGKHLLYRFNIYGLDTQTIMEKIISLRITGARITNERLELSDVECIPSPLLQELEKLYGSVTVLPCEVVQVRRY